MKEELRHWATVISVALAVTAGGMKYAHVEFQIRQFEKDALKMEKDVDLSRQDIEFLKADVRVKGQQIQNLLMSLNRLHTKQSERYEDE